MLDALIPAVAAFRAALDPGAGTGTGGLPLRDALRVAADAAQQGALATASMPPRRGRSSYLGDRALGHPDPGAEAVAAWLRAIAQA
jgi:dihydroxyacetone kinase